MTKLVHILIAIAILTAFQVEAAAQPHCMTINMASSAASFTNVTALASVANCFPPNAQLLNISLSVTSSNDAVAAPVNNSIPIQDPNALIGAQFLIHGVTSCTPVTITFSVSAAGTTTAVTKTLMVCPFSFDIGVSTISGTPNAAGQLSQVDVVLFNEGNQTLFANTYSVGLSTQEDTSGLVRDSCNGFQPPTSVQGPDLPDIPPGERRTVSLNFRFPQAGTFTLRATASMSGGEDGPSANNVRSQTVSVPLPLPLICSVTNTGGLVTIDGNWFIPFGSSTVPTVRFGNSPAASVQVVSPRQITARISSSACLESLVPVTVANSTGSTSRGSVSPNRPRIIGLSRQGNRLRIRLADFRPSCFFEVSIAVAGRGRIPAEVVSQGRNVIVINLPPLPVGIARVTVSTLYGMTTRAFW